MLKDSLHSLVGIAVEELVDTRELEEEGPDLSHVISHSLEGSEAGPQVGEIVANQLVIRVGHHMVVREEHCSLGDRVRGARGVFISFPSVK